MDCKSAYYGTDSPFTFDMTLRNSFPLYILPG